MRSFIDRIISFLLGAEVEVDGYDKDTDRERYTDESSDINEDVKSYKYGRGEKDVREADGLDPINKRKTSKNSNVIDFQGTQNEETHQILIVSPVDEQDAPFICDHVMDHKVCVVNLENVDGEAAQRIADYLGGAAFALGGDIERISNEIFVIAPASFRITAALKEELRANTGHVLPWASSLR